uniref:hypothetical protein n=1 Tax=Paractinoplanes polyasparticus TaxID=2856853 RepID=UPI001C849B38|nr:hypothetical protein [Actinoplanes polyasparticus]
MTDLTDVQLECLHLARVDGLQRIGTCFYSAGAPLPVAWQHEAEAMVLAGQLAVTGTLVHPADYLGDL